MSETVSQRNNLIKLGKKKKLKSLTQSLAFLVQHKIYVESLHTGSKAPLEMNRRLLRHVKLSHSYIVPSFLHIHLTVTHVNSSTAYMAQTAEFLYI